MVEEIQVFLEGINTKHDKAWKLLYANYYSPLCCYAQKILKDREQAADVVQSMIVNLWQANVHFEDIPSFHGYLYKSVYHNCLKSIREKNTAELYLSSQEKEDDFTNPESFAAVIEEEMVRKLRDIIHRMSGKRKEVMLLCLEGKKVEEVSELLGISTNTVKKHKKEAYQLIRELLKSDILILLYIISRNI